jgi:hypothetical protein
MKYIRTGRCGAAIFDGQCLRPCPHPDCHKSIRHLVSSSMYFRPKCSGPSITLTFECESGHISMISSDDHSGQQTYEEFYVP